jgi:callose synthase
MKLLTHFQMAKELDGILDSSEAEPAKSCITSDGSTSYLDKIITPIYQTMAAVGLSMNGFSLIFPLSLLGCN